MPRKFLTVAIALGALTLLWQSVPSAAAQERPFFAEEEGFNTGLFFFGAGNATHLGRYADSGFGDLTQQIGPTSFILSGGGTLTAANGDTLDYLADGVMDKSIRPWAATGTITFTGGTGRFTNARGTASFIFTLNPADGAYLLIANGTIDY